MENVHLLKHKLFVTFSPSLLVSQAQDSVIIASCVVSITCTIQKLFASSSITIDDSAGIASI